MTFKPSRIIAGVMNWGAWGANLDTTDISKLIKGCLDIGVTTFDHADIYGGYTTETAFGQAIQKSGIRRGDYQLITKCGIMFSCENRPEIAANHYHTSKEHIAASVDRSLLNLKSEYIDLLLLHRPSPLMDPNIISEAIADLKLAGKIRHFGVSNFTNSQASLLMSKTPVEANQVEISPYALESMTDGVLDQCIEKEMLPMAWSPMGGGKLFGMLSDPFELEKRARLQSIAVKYGWELDYMLYLWLLHHPANIHPVTGSSKLSRINTAVTATKENISDAQWFEIYTACLGRGVD